MSKAHINSKLSLLNNIISVDDATILLDHCQSDDFVSSRGQYAIVDPSNEIYPSRNGVNKISPSAIRLTPTPIGSGYTFTFATKNLIVDGDFSDTYVDANVGWDNNRNGTYLFNSWTLYNGGVTSPTIGYHAHVGLGLGIDGENCIEYIDYNAQFGFGHRWLGSSQSIDRTGLTYGNKICISMYIKVDNIGKPVNFGIYHYDPSTAGYSFSGMGLVERYATKANEWQRVCAVFTIPQAANIDLTKSMSLFLYGTNGTEGRLLVSRVTASKVLSDESADYYNQASYPSGINEDGGLVYDLLATPRTTFFWAKLMDSDKTRDRNLMSLYNLGSISLNVYTATTTGNLKLQVFDGTTNYYAEVPTSTVNLFDENWHSIAVITNTAYTKINESDARSGYVCKLIVDGKYSAQTVTVGDANPSASKFILEKKLNLGFDKLGVPCNATICEIRCDMVEYNQEDILSWTLYNKQFYDPYGFNAYIY